MPLNFRFAVISDPHIALPQTIWDHPHRFHLVEVSIPAFEQSLDRLAQLDLDFLLLPGDLTQHGEIENHAWLSRRLAELPYPVYVVPGNHDIVERSPTLTTIGAAEFPRYYQKFGYDQPNQIYYTHEILPGVRLIGLNSIAFDADGQQLGMGSLDNEQLNWLKTVLAAATDEFLIVMIHHNVVEHLPGQARHNMGRRYMLDNAPDLLHLLQAAGVKLIFTGHLHVQDIASWQGIYEITTGSLVSYPHPYRLLSIREEAQNQFRLQIETDWITEVPGWENLQQLSREWMGDRSLPFMIRLLTHPPFNFPVPEAEVLAPHLRYFWADIASGDNLFDFPQFPEKARQYFKKFGAIDALGKPLLIDYHTTLDL
jgi:3',5'-cyclic AMP phosphodiesterase CpdA